MLLSSEGAPGQLPQYRVPGQEGPSPQCQAGHELDGQAGAAVSQHHLGVAMDPGHVQDQVGPAGQGRGSQRGSQAQVEQRQDQDLDPGGGRLTAGSAEAPPWLLVS